MNETTALPKSWFQRETATVARELVGSVMSFVDDEQNHIRCRIVETEAYLAADDAACHASLSRTPRNEPMFAEGGILYVYRIYGVHFCANIVTETEGRGCAVLLRAAEVMQGHSPLRDRRLAKTDADLLRGPGNFCRALSLNLSHNYLECYSHRLSFHQQCVPTEVVTSTRIGITKSRDLPLRFFELKSTSVSSHKRKL